MMAQPVWKPSDDSQQPFLVLCMCLLSARTPVTLVCLAVLMMVCTHGSKRKCSA